MSKLRKLVQTTGVWTLSGLLLISVSLSLVPAVRVNALSGQTVAAISNTYRANNGLPALGWNSLLGSSAQAKANDMCAKGYWSHVAPDGATAWTFIARAGYSYTTAAENIAKGYNDPGAVVAGWMASAGHRANILSSSFTETGVGSASCLFEGAQTTFTVAHYGASRSAPRAPAPAPAAPRAAKTTTAAARPARPATASQQAAAASPPPEVKPVVTKRCFGAEVWQTTMQMHDNLLSQLRASGHPDSTQQSACPQ